MRWFTRIGLIALLSLPIAIASAAPEDYHQVSLLDQVALPTAGSAAVLLSPRLLAWPQLEVIDGNTLLLHEPGREPRRLYQCEPLYQLGEMFGVAEGDWVVFTEVPTGGVTAAQHERLIAIWLPRGRVYDFDLEVRLDRRYAYAFRLFGFPYLEGSGFYWLYLADTGEALFGSEPMERNLERLIPNGNQLITKDLDPKGFQGSDKIGYRLWWNPHLDGTGKPVLETMPELRMFPSERDGRYNAEQLIWDGLFMVMGVEDPASRAPSTTIASNTIGATLTVPGRMLGYADSKVAWLDGEQVKVAGIVPETLEAGPQLSLRGIGDIALGSASTLGRVVWITGARFQAHLLILELQVQLPGKSYPVDRLGSGVLAVWDLKANKLVGEYLGHVQ